MNTIRVSHILESKVKIKEVIIIRTSQEARKKKWKTIRIQERSQSCLTGTSPGAPHTQLGVSRRRGARTPDAGKVSAGQPDRWTPPEGGPDRCNSANPVEGDIPEGRFQG